MSDKHCVGEKIFMKEANVNFDEERKVERSEVFQMKGTMNGMLKKSARER